MGSWVPGSHFFFPLAIIKKKTGHFPDIKLSHFPVSQLILGDWKGRVQRNLIQWNSINSFHPSSGVYLWLHKEEQSQDLGQCHKNSFLPTFRLNASSSWLDKCAAEFQQLLGFTPPELPFKLLVWHILLLILKGASYFIEFYSWKRPWETSGLMHLLWKWSHEAHRSQKTCLRSQSQ